MSSCDQCVCYYCLNFWSFRCPYGCCYDDKRAVDDPYDLAHPGKPPRTQWSNWNKPGEQAYWCRGGVLYPSEECEHFIQYEDQEIVQCHEAMTQVFQDGYRICSMMVNGSCEQCLTNLERTLNHGTQNNNARNQEAGLRAGPAAESR